MAVTISIPDAVKMAEATVRLWDYGANGCQSQFFHFTPQLFADWRTNHELNRILGANLTQTTEGLIRFTSCWEDRTLTTARCQMRIYAAIEDANDERRYEHQARARWYQHILGQAMPDEAGDREWIDLVNLTIQGWRKAAMFMRDKREAGMSMIAEENGYLEASRSATTLVSDLYTEQITYEEAIRAARDLTERGNQWTEAANYYYSLTPTDMARQGLSELIGNMENIVNWDYMGNRTELMAGDNRPCLLYRNEPNLTIRSFDHLRDTRYGSIGDEKCSIFSRSLE